MYDVSSLYPTSMINFGLCSRSMADPEAFRKLVELRLDFKRKAKEGDADAEKKQLALKLVINSTYGAMLASTNPLEDRKHGRSVCISNQLCMLVLMTTLSEEIESLSFVNINTDGILIKVSRKDLEKVRKIVSDWEKLTGFSMEEDLVEKIWQRDVNNYLLIKQGGKVKAIGCLRAWKGGNFKQNSKAIIPKAVVLSLLEGKPVKEVVESETEITAFQQVVACGGGFEELEGSFSGSVVRGQKVNRLFAVKDRRWGQAFKVGPGGKKAKVPSGPPHARIDNLGNEVNISDIDYAFYIAEAEKLLESFKKAKKVPETEVIVTPENKLEKPTRKEVQSMVEAKEVVTEVTEVKVEEVADRVPFVSEVCVTDPETGLGFSVKAPKGKKVVWKVEDGKLFVSFESEKSGACEVSRVQVAETEPEKEASISTVRRLRMACVRLKKSGQVDLEQKIRSRLEGTLSQKEADDLLSMCWKG